MRLLLAFEPGFVLALVALVTRVSHAPSMRLELAIGVVCALALLPFGLLLRRPKDEEAAGATPR